MTDKDLERDYDREIFRSSLYSALWALLAEKKKQGFRLSDVAERLGKDKGYVSRLFSKQENCKLNSISDLAHAMNAEIKLEVVDRASGRHFGAGGPHRSGAMSRTIVKRSYDLASEDESMQMTVRRG